ncbi:MAG: hypothetical protein NT175_06620 [Bacteroidetes bacterium]|nr:hypothetical protein [Bacteroidota bacterium]
MENLTLGIGTRIVHPEFGAGVVIQVYSDAYEITFIDHGTKQILKSFQGLKVTDFVSQETDLLSYEKMEKRFLNIIRRFSDLQETVTMAKKWIGGRLILEPGDKDLQGKDMPIDILFHKIVMIRDRLRVMEQKVNSSNLPEVDKIEIQQYITRIYGSLTSFNVLFAEKDDYFIGDKGK